MSWPFDHVSIRASAGTGKTYALTSRFIALLHAGIPAERILATTFTRKAAGEILDRVMRRLAAAARDSRELSQLGEAIRVQDLTAGRAMQMAVSLARSLHRLRICTLDSFFSAVSGSFALELGLPPQWRIAEEVADQQMRAEAVRRVLDEADIGQTLALLRMINRDYASRSVTGSIQRLIGSAYEIYCQTPREAWFTLPRGEALAPDALGEALESLVHAPMATNNEGTPSKAWVNAHCKSVEAARRQDWEALLCGGLGGYVLSGSERYSGKPITDEVCAAYEPMLRHARAVVLGRMADQVEASWRLLHRFDAAYWELKHRRRELRFEDVTRLLAEAEVTGESAEMYYRLDGAIDHLLLDEFQDTSMTQWSVLRPIAQEITAHGDGQRSSLFVGDVKQAVYGWRGGEAAIFDRLESELPALRVEPLSHSFRSAQPVIDVVNAVFGSLTQNVTLADCADAAAAWQDEFHKHTTARTHLRGYVRLESAPAASDDAPQEPVTLAYTARLVKQLHQEAPDKSIGVLVRQNSKQQIARLLYELDREGVRASEEGGNPLTDSAAVQLILSLLTMADHPGDTACRFHVATSPLATIVRYSDFESDRLTERRASEIRARLLADGYGPTLQRWTSELAAVCDSHELSRLMQLVALGHQYDAEATLRPGDFVRFIASQKVEDPTAANVRVMTIHASKGLQFDAVVLPQLTGVTLTERVTELVAMRDAETLEITRVCPWLKKELLETTPELQPIFTRNRQRVVQESLCGLYVAMTRPKQALYMVVDPKRARQAKASYANVLLNSLTDGADVAPQQLLYEHGEADWWMSREQKDSAPTVAVYTAAELPTPALAASTQRRLVPRRSPSSMEGGEAVELAHRLRLDTNAARQRGSAIHALFEQVEWLDDAPPEEAALMQAAAPRVSGDDVAATLGEFRRMIEQPAVREALTRGAYPAGASLELLREESFALRTDDGLLGGTFDRVVVVRAGGKVIGVDIVDFKTDRVRGDEQIAERVRHYTPQIQAYRGAAAAMYRVDVSRVTARLLFVTAGRAVAV